MPTPSAERGRFQILAWCLACLPLYAMSAIATLEGVLPAYVFVYVAMPMCFFGLSILNAESITSRMVRLALVVAACLPYVPVGLWFIHITKGTTRADLGLFFGIAHGPMTAIYAVLLYWLMTKQATLAAARATGCPHCGYSKEGLEGGKCPECGETISRRMSGDEY